MNPYSVPTDEEKRQMLSSLGVDSIDQLFADVPNHLYLDTNVSIPEGVSEYEALSYLEEVSNLNLRGTSYLGCGSYDRIIPSAVKHLSSLPTFLTAYTPYQPEISQGTLQAIFEFQSIICELTGMDVSNASLYDGHTAASEAVIIAKGSKRKGNVLLVSSTVHPSTVEVVRTHVSGSDIVIKMVGQKDGVVDTQELTSSIDDEVFGVLLQSPNVYGYAEDYSGVADAVHQKKAKLIISSDPIALGMIKPQAEWGADIAIGDLQSCGLASCFGGPSTGYIATEEKLLRKLPGRIVGQTVDSKGRRAFVLTLQAREQHIKRERATSNICSNQAHAALTNAIYVSLLGYEGLQEVARQSMSKAHYLYEQLVGLEGVKPYSSQPFLYEFTVDLGSAKRLDMFLSHMRQKGIFAGVRLSRICPDVCDSLLTVAVTEKRTRTELDRYITAAKEVLV